MAAESAQLVFANDPTAPLSLLVGAALLLMAVYHAVRTLRTAGRRRGTLLVALRSLAVLILGVILLQPSLMETHRVVVPLPDSFIHKEVRVFDPSAADALLPDLASLQLPTRRESRDVAIKDVVVPPVAYYKSRATIKLSLVNEGPPQAGVVVVSKLESGHLKELSRTGLVLEPGRQDVGISVVPETLGSVAYAIRLEGFADDPEPENNTSLFALTVARESLRILHIAGHPSWDVRFLRQFLTSMPGLDLISFYLLVDSEDFAPHSREELALIPFPTDELFLQEIGNFDLIIVHNFPLGTYFLLTPEHLERMVRFVKEGGALLFVGGDKAFAAGKVHKTPVTQVLPLELLPADGEAGWAEGPLTARLDPDGLTHPLTTSGAGEDSAPFPLADLPPLLAAHRLGALKPWGTLLASAQAGDTRIPLIVAGQRGRGRVLVVTTDSLWRWAFPPSLQQDAPAIYRRFLMNALGWLTRDPRLEEVTITAVAGTVTAGEETPTRVCLRTTVDAESRVQVRAEWLDAAGRKPALRVELEAPLADARCARVTLPPAHPGAWEVFVRVETDAREYTGSDVLTVRRQEETYADRLRERIAPLLAVQFAVPDAGRPFPATARRRDVTLDRPVLHTLWVSPAFFLGFVLLLLAEWMLRKRWGYL